MLRAHLVTVSARILPKHTLILKRFLNCDEEDEEKTPPSNKGGEKISATLIPGDGVGPELVNAVKDVYKAGNVPVEFDQFYLTEDEPSLSSPLQDVISSIIKNKVCLKGIIKRPLEADNDEIHSLDMDFRRQLDLYANVVHVKSLPGIKTRHEDIDMVIIREQTEGEYSALEHEGYKGIVESLKIVTYVKSKRIAKFAFDYAVKFNRKKVTAVHKANIMKLADGLFLRSCEEISILYPKVKFETMIVDNATMQMVSKPQQFDVVVTTNLYGSIMDNLASGLVGGAGVVAGASYSNKCVTFEPGARHIFFDAIGKDIANPTAMILCSAKLLNHVNLTNYSLMIRNAVYDVINEGKVLTKDIGGQAGTHEFTKAVIDHLKLP